MPVGKDRFMALKGHYVAATRIHGNTKRTPHLLGDAELLEVPPCLRHLIAWKDSRVQAGRPAAAPFKYHKEGQ